MSKDSTEADGPLRSSDDSSSEQDTSIDAKGFASRIFGGTGTKKKAIGIEKITEREQTDATKLIPRYNMGYVAGSFRGIAVIINNEHFHWSTGMNQRRGTKADEKNLSRLFHKLDFDVRIYNDVSVAQIKQIVKEMSGHNHSKFDCFFMVFLSHGDNGMIYGVDGTIEISPLTDKFTGKKCPSLIGKPKVFLFQACRGYNHEDPVDDTSGSGDVVDGFASEVIIDAGVAPTLPNASDFLFCYSVTEGFYSHRDTLYGSWYIQSFVEVFEEELINRGKTMAMRYDVLSLLTLVNHKVSQKSVERTRNPDAVGKKQMPCFLSMLTKQFFLAPKEY